MSETESYLTEKLHELTTRVYRLESILMNPPKDSDFTREDQLLKSMLRKISEAKHRIPHPESQQPTKE